MAAGGESGSSSGSSEPDSPNWVMLDRYVFTRCDLPACEEDGTTSPERCTSQGVPFRVSLRFSAPPAISRFYLHMPTGAADHHCRILGTHRDALLFSMYVPLPDPMDDRYPCSPEGERPPRFSKQEMFVYIAGSMPSLTPLAPCTGSDSDDTGSLEEGDGAVSFAADEDASFAQDDDNFELGKDEDAVVPGYNPLAGIIQFPDLQAVGVLCNDRGEYVVAYLCVSRCITPGSGAEMVEAQMCVFCSSESKWELHALPIFYRDDEDLHEILKWSTSRVFTYGSNMCWVDYNCGILFCDMFAKRLRVTYFSLPVEAHCFPEACMDMYRNVCVVDDEGAIKIKFIDVTPSHGYIFRPPPSNGFVVNIWTLITEEGDMTWKHDFMIQDNELNISKFVSSPHGPLMFPVISMDEPHVAHFIVGEHGYRIKNVWLVHVDLIGRLPKYVFPYLKGKEDLLGEDAEMARSKSTCFEPFLQCNINMFFPQITGDKSHKTAIRNAPVSLPSCPQADLPGDSSKTSVKKEGPILPWVSSSDVQEPNVGRLRSEESIDCAQNIATRIACPQCVTSDSHPKRLEQVSFRLLCPIDLVGGLIGRKGLVIKGIENETGVFIDIGYNLSGCVERVITIAALERPEQCSKVQGALLRIFDRMVEVEMNAHSMFDKRSQFLARALVTKSQIGCLVGLGGATLKEMVKLTRARIQILDETDVPACASRCERVIQITGELLDVTYALCLVSWKLRYQVFCSERTNYNSGYVPSSDFAGTSTIRKSNISSAGQFSTNSFPCIDHGCSLSYEIDRAENSFSSIDFGPLEAKKPVHGDGVRIKSSNDRMSKPAYSIGYGISSTNRNQQHK